MVRLKYLLLKYSIELIIIILGIFLSIRYEENREKNHFIEMKNESLIQLSNVINNDIDQINYFKNLQSKSLEHSNKILKVIDHSTELNTDSVMLSLSYIGRALRSFFPQQGAFNQLVSLDLIKLIDSSELNILLFKLYNEDLLRHDVHTKEYDAFFLKFNYTLTQNFLLDDAWDINPSNPVSIVSYQFNEEYFYSHHLHGDIIEARSSINNYLVELDYLEKKFLLLKDLIYDEINLNI